MTPAALEWITRFRRYLTSERRLSPHTDSNYARDLAALVAYCDREDLQDWSRLTSHTLRHFAARQHGSGLSPRSIQRRLSAVRSFYDFLLRESLPRRATAARGGPEPAIKSNPGAEVRAPKAPRRLPATLDADQMARLLDIPAGDGWTSRDRAIMELLYSSGLRLAELVGLDVTDLQCDGGSRARMVRVVGKGAKERIVPVGRKAAEAIERWLQERAASAGVGETALFVGRNGTRLGARAVQLRVAHWARLQGLEVPVHPHLFRHSFATHVLESSQDLRGVQEMLGHASLATTQIYTHLDFQHLARIYEASHPRARRKPRT